MKNLGEISDPNDIVTKEYVDQKCSGGGSSIKTEIIDGWHVQKYENGECEGYKDIIASGTFAALSSSGTLAAFGYFLINAQTMPSGITVDCVTADLIKTDGWGFLVRMASSSANATYRFVTFGNVGATRNLTIRWKFTGTY